MKNNSSGKFRGRATYSETKHIAAKLPSKQIISFWGYCSQLFGEATKYRYGTNGEQVANQARVVMITEGFVI